MAYLPQLAFQPYVSTPVGQPTKEISDLGTSLNQRYDENIAKYDALDSYINQIQVNDVDSHLKEGLKNDTRNAIANIAQNGDWENAKTPVREVARRLNNDPIIKKAQQNYLTAKQLDEQRLKAAEEGKPLIQFQDYHNFSTIDPTTGQARDLPLSGVYEQKLDPLAKMREIFADVNPDSYAYKNSTPMRDDESGSIYQIGSGASKRFLSKAKLEDVANRNFETYLNTTEGQQRLKVLTTSNSENHNPVDTQTALAHMKSELLNVGLNKAFTDTSSESTQKLAPGQGTKKTPEDGYRLTQDKSFQQNQDLDKLIDGLDKKKRTSLEGMAASIPTGYGLNLFGSGDNAHPQDKTPKYDIPKEFKPAYDSVYGMFSKSMKTTDVDKINSKVKEYFTNIKNSSIEPKYFAYDGKKIEEENKFIRNGNLDGRLFLDADSPGGTPLTWTQITGKAGSQNEYKNESGKVISDSDLKDAVVSGEYDENNPFMDMTNNDLFASPQKFRIGGHNFIMGSDQQEKHSPNFVEKVVKNRASRAVRTGMPTEFINPETKSKVTIIQSPDGNYLIRDGKNLLHVSPPEGSKLSPLDAVTKYLTSTNHIVSE